MKKNHNEIVVYQTRTGAINLRSDADERTVWATQSQMAQIFGVNPQAVTKHLKNIYKENELNKKATCSNMEQVQIEGSRKVVRRVEIYNMDAIISVGYRISSLAGTRFRQWATRVLRSYIVEGYAINAINKKRIALHYDAFKQAVANVHELLPADASVSGDQILELVSAFADTWFSLNAFDKGVFSGARATRKKVSVTAQKLLSAIATLKAELLAKGLASDLFASERAVGSVEGIVGNVMQSFGGADLYPTLEEKAAHILYFMVKNHPFVDGNKRSGAFAFVWFLRQAGILNVNRMTPEALTALTLLVAASVPADKGKMIGLVLLLLGTTKIA